MEKLSPMMAQYAEIKKKYKDYILFYRLGDFYEMFFEDAVLASKELDLTLTGRDCGQKEKAPMCGVPYHSVEAYIQRLIQNGHKIAISEQVSDPKEQKGIVKREVVRIITPGTVTETSMLDAAKNNFICSIYKNSDEAAVAFCDITEGTIYATYIKDEDITGKILNEVGKFAPSEAVLCDNSTNDEKLCWFLTERLNCFLEKNQQERFVKDNEYILSVFPDYIPSNDALSCVICGILSYLRQTQMDNLKNITKLDIYTKNQFLELDVNARYNLELTETMRDKSKKGSLLWVIDQTKTSMGARLLRKFLEKPLVNPMQITKRLNLVEELYSNEMILDEVEDSLKNITDIERLIGKVVYQNANPKDLKSLENAINYIPNIKNSVEKLQCELATTIFNQIDLLTEIQNIISKAIIDNPPLLVREGGVIREGFDENVDHLRKMVNGGKENLMEIEAREKEKTGIKNLKIGYNKVFGYYIEVTKSNIADVPDYYIRKQTLANQERYVIEDLKIHENTVLSAQDKLIKLEQEIYKNILIEISKHVSQAQKTATAIALLDVLHSFAKVSKDNDFSKPVVNLSDKINITDGRHPVVEKMLNKSIFVPNNTVLNETSDNILVITGPNMAGKSTYMRQVAIIVILAQIGCFVPCKYAEIGIVDKIFTRVGASDDLSTGQSTFMVEMNEVSNLLKNSTKKSLVLLDEVGRGTSTFDGMSIAKSIVEYISKKIGCKTLFSTHYHELTCLENELNGVVNYNILAKKTKDDIIFLRKIEKGAADDSYGIEVAKLAGLPKSLITRANEILLELENTELNAKNLQIPKEQVSFEMQNEDKIIKELKSYDVNSLSPLDALNLISKLKQML